jgi:hypothetical protein
MGYDQGPFPSLWIDRSPAGSLFTSDENMEDGIIEAQKNYGSDKAWPAPQGWDRPDHWHGAAASKTSCS